MAFAPRSVLCGSMPRTVRQNIMAGDRKCHGPPRVGLKRVCLRRKAEYLTVVLLVGVDTTSASMLGSRAQWIGDRKRRTLGPEELAGDVDGLTSHHNNLLAVEELLGDGAGKTTKEMALCVNDDLTDISLVVLATLWQIPRRTAHTVMSRDNEGNGNIPPVQSSTWWWS